MKSANQNNKIAQFKVGKFYRYGYGVKFDANEAFIWTKKAADQGYVNAENNIGLYYEEGFKTA